MQLSVSSKPFICVRRRRFPLNNTQANVSAVRHPRLDGLAAGSKARQPPDAPPLRLFLKAIPPDRLIFSF